MKQFLKKLLRVTVRLIKSINDALLSFQHTF